MTGASALAIEGVSKIYGRKIVFRGISLILAKGAITLVTGPNGAGKSTLLRIMAGLCQPSEGRITRADGLRMAYLGHATFLYPGLTALENLLFWAKAFKTGASRQDALNVLAKMNLTAHANVQAGVFSRGMAQKLNFARVLLLRPQALLLDEPFSGLDAESRELMRSEIVSGRDNGAAIAMVSHHLDEDLAMADNIIALRKGRLAYGGSARDYTQAGETPL